MAILTVSTAHTVQPAAFDVLGARLGAERVAIRQLALVADQIHQITRDAEVQVVSRDIARLGLRLEPGSWCVAECLDHLAHTTRSFLPAISDSVAEAPK